MYSDLGFDKRLGEYQGSVNQNLSMLKQLQTETPKPVQPATEILSSYDTSQLKPGTDPDVLAALQPTGQMTKVPTPAMNTSTALDTLGVKPTTTGSAASYLGTAITPGTDAEVAAQVSKIDAGKKETGVTAPVSETPDETSMVDEWINSPEGQAFLNRQEISNLSESAKTAAAKQELEAKYQSDLASLDSKLNNIGMGRSGLKATQVAGLASSLAASLLGEDRALAVKLLEADADLRDAILQGVADLAKDADAGRKEAIQQLNAVGYAVIDGQLVPTLSARAGERAEKSLALSEARLSLAEAAAARAEGGNKLTLSEVTARKLPVSLVGASEQDVADSFYSPTAPAWFQEKFSNENSNFKPPYSPYEVQLVNKAWDAERQSYITGTTDSTNRAKATSYFSSAYGDAVTSDQMKVLVDRVELYINQGETYANAIQKVIDEAS